MQGEFRVDSARIEQHRSLGQRRSSEHGLVRRTPASSIDVSNAAIHGTAACRNGGGGGEIKSEHSHARYNLYQGCRPPGLISHRGWEAHLALCWRPRGRRVAIAPAPQRQLQKHTLLAQCARGGWRVCARLYSQRSISTPYLSPDNRIANAQDPFP